MDDFGQPRKSSSDGLDPSDRKPTGDSDTPIFGVREERRGGLPLAVWIVVAIALAGGIAAIFFATRKAPAVAPVTLQPADAYAGSLELSQFAMSEATNLSGGKLTYLDGQVQNAGTRTISGITVQVVFQNDEAMPPQIETLPLTLIRTREPYIDIEPVSSEPLKPGDNRDFRLTFDTVSPNWNTQMPLVRVIRVDSK